MRKHYDFSNAKPNPYIKGKKVPVSIRLDAELIQWLVEESKRQNLRGYQTLANALLVKSMEESKPDLEARVERLEKALLKKKHA